MNTHKAKMGAMILACLMVTASAFKNHKDLPVEYFKDCSDCPEMVVIPAGTFLMGATPGEGEHPKEEGPQRKVSVARFAAGKFDITRGQWSAFVLATNRPVGGGCAWSGFATDKKPWELNPIASWKNLGFDQDDTHPVVCVSWKDVQDYVAWLSKKTGKGYRLLTEAEWEYAARAGSATPYPWGSKASHEFANYGLDSTFGKFATGRDQWMYTSPVGSFPPNAFGLFDMHGNVMQYVEDCFSPTYTNLPENGSAFKSLVKLSLEGELAGMNGTNSCDYRMIRGGDYNNPSSMIRSASRNFTPGPGLTLDNYRSTGLGLRIAKSL